MGGGEVRLELPSYLQGLRGAYPRRQHCMLETPSLSSGTDLGLNMAG